jgi:hypothetical protein
MCRKPIRKTTAYLLLASLGLAFGGCERLDAPIVTQKLPSIPASYGDLKGITPDQDQPFQSVLWFEQSDKTIVAVRVNIARGTILANTVKFPRS